MRPRLSAAIAATSICFLALAACSTAPPAPTAADGEFVRDMAQSAAFTLDLADQARIRTSNPKVQTLADDVFAAMGPLADQLTELGPALAADGADGFAHEDSEDHATESAEKSADLRAATPRAFDSTFLEMVRDELTRCRQIADAARAEATDTRSKAAADTATSVCDSLIKRVDRAS